MGSISRFHRFVKTVASSYMVTGAAFVAALISTPLALHYLPKREFALWALLMQIVGYLTLVDFGMSLAIARLLIDHKDRPEDGQYGSLIQTGFLVGLVQGALILVIGSVIAPEMTRLLEIPADLQATFVSLIRWQLLITAATFGTRVLRHILHSQNRNDITNYGQIVVCLLTTIVLCVGLRQGLGVSSILLSNAVGLTVYLLFSLAACANLGFFPQRNQWGRVTREKFNHLFAFGRDVFFIHLGSQLLMATQTAIISRRLGLEAVAAWAVATDAFTALCSLLYQIFDYSSPALAEMMVRGDSVRLRQRFLNLLTVSMTLASVAAVIFMTTNRAFVAVWTNGKILWPAVNDGWLALWMLLLVWLHLHSGFVMMTKKLAAMRYIYVIEGCVFLGLALWIVPHCGIPGMIATSVVCTLCLSGSYGARRSRQYFEFSWAQMEFPWLAAMGKMLGGLVPLAVILIGATRPLAPLWQFLICGTIMSSVGAIVFCRFGIPLELRSEILNRLPERWQRIFGRFCGEANPVKAAVP